MRLKERTCVVAGGATGWGRAVSERLAAEGATVIVLDASQAEVDSTSAAIAKAGGRVRGFAVDIADQKAMEELVSDNRQIFQPASGLVTHYVAIAWGAFEECDMEEFARIVRHNLVGPAIATKVLLPILKAAGKASIVHLGSVDGIHGNPRVPSYSAAKGGLIPLTRVHSFEFAKYDIRVNTIASAQTVQIAPEDMPPTAELGFAGFPGASYMQQLNDATPLKRYGPLTDWAGAAAFLLSEDADYITGTTLVVDCGRTAITAGTQ
ncbi:MAG: SDR family NAD(P)-dependent oxidoreductase [Flavobacteriaceae bacterium]